jgi:hypothetical protein
MDRFTPVVRERINAMALFWLLAAISALFPFLMTAELIDGDTRYLWNREVTAWRDPALFAVSVALDLALLALTTLLCLAAISATNVNWLPEKLRDKPLQLLASMVLLTLIVIASGVDIASGDITLRRRAGRLFGRHLTEDGTPIRYAVVFVLYLIGVMLTGLGWFWVRWRWKNPEKIVDRWKPTFEDRSKHGHMD